MPVSSMEVSPVRKCYYTMKQECGKEMRILPHASFVYHSASQNLPFLESNTCCTSDMLKDMTRERERDLALGGYLFIGRNKTDVPSFSIGLPLTPHPPEEIYI